MNIYYLMGGNFNDNSELLDDIKKEKEINKILFIDEANQNHQKNYITFKERYSLTNKETRSLDQNDSLLIQILEADLIFLNGGRTEALYQYLLNNNFIDILNKVDNKIFVGVSAGAIIFFEYGYGDKDVYYDQGTYYGFNFTKGLGYYNKIFCPHYQKEGILSFNSEFLKYNLDGYALTDGALMKIKGNHFSIIKEKNAQAFKLDKSSNTLVALFPGHIYEL